MTNDIKLQASRSTHSSAADWDSGKVGDMAASWTTAKRSQDRYLVSEGKWKTFAQFSRTRAAALASISPLLSSLEQQEQASNPLHHPLVGLQIESSLSAWPPAPPLIAISGWWIKDPVDPCPHRQTRQLHNLTLEALAIFAHRAISCLLPREPRRLTAGTRDRAMIPEIECFLRSTRLLEPGPVHHPSQRLQGPLTRAPVWRQDKGIL